MAPTLLYVVTGVSMKSLSLVLATCLVLIGCGKPLQIADADSALGKTSSKTVKSIRHYRGGYFPPPNQPNWAYDTMITFQADGSAFVKGKDYDPLCFKTGHLGSLEALQLEEMLENLQIVQSDGLKAVDAGIETIEVTWNEGGTSKIHLMNMEVPAGEYVATNGSDLSDRLEEISANLAKACQ